MSSARRINSTGNTLLEVLVVISLFAIIVTMTVPSLQATRHLTEVATTQEQSFQKRVFVQDSVMRALMKSRALRGLQLWSLARTAHFSPRGLPHDHTPAPDSTILSVIEIDPHLTFTTTQQIEGQLVGCINPQEFFPPQTEFWLGIALHGAVTFRSKLAIPKNDWCQAKLTPQAQGNELRFPFQRGLATHAVVAYPIRDAYSLYRDRTGTFRRLSALTTESQPLVYGISDFIINEHPRELQLLVAVEGDEIKETVLPKTQPSEFDYLELTL